MVFDGGEYGWQGIGRFGRVVVGVQAPGATVPFQYLSLNR
jgi:hypothetical protein